MGKKVKKVVKNNMKNAHDGKKLNFNFNFSLSLKSRIVLGFIVPVLLVVLVGLRAYRQSSKGLIDNYKKANINSMRMAVNLLDYGLDSVIADANELYKNDDVKAFAIMPKANKQSDHEGIRSTVNKYVRTKLNTNHFLSAITLIPKNELNCLSTSGITTILGSTIFDEIEKEGSHSETGDYVQNVWSSEHPKMNELLHFNGEKSFGSLFSTVNYDKVAIILDINKAAIKEILTDLDLGAGSKVAYITVDRKELNRDDESTYSFLGESFIEEAFQSEEQEKAVYEEIQGESYLFIYKKSTINGSMICAAVPEKTIVKEAREIRHNTVVSIFLAGILVLIIGTSITLYIQKNIQRIMKELERASKGDLNIDLYRKGNTEFDILSTHIQEVITNTKNLINEVKSISKNVSNSSEQVAYANTTLNESIDHVKLSITEISNGTSIQANSAIDCSKQMDYLSEKILSSVQKVEKMEEAADQSQKLIVKGSDVVNELVSQAMQSSEITNDVRMKANALKEHTNEIYSLTQKINEISDQTSLLALNASIEAARAGSLGNGFAVVASEIKTLANYCLQYSKNIEGVIHKVLGMTNDTVDAVNKAQEINTLQVASVENTKNVFIKMNESIEELLSDMKQVIHTIHDMSKDRLETLNAIENISAVSQQTSASTITVGESVEQQIEEAKRLTDITEQLSQDTEHLLESIRKFII